MTCSEALAEPLEPHGAAGVAGCEPAPAPQPSAGPSTGPSTQSSAAPLRTGTARTTAVTPKGRPKEYKK